MANILELWTNRNKLSQEKKHC